MAEGTEQPSTTTSSSSLSDWLRIYLTGICMGAADMVPGISGGTIALITGIYERLITAIAALDPHVLTAFPAARTGAGRQRLSESLEEMDVPFLLVLGAGIATAILLLSRVIPVAFDNYPAVTSAFFFSLMAASALVIYRGVRVETPAQQGVGVIGVVIAFVLGGATNGGQGGTLPVVFLAGAVAVSAMVLPGISGAAFLYVLGQYEYLLGSLNDFLDAVVGLPVGGGVDAVIDTGPVVIVFVTGAAVGLVTMARVVSWALERYRVALLVFLVGLMVGALRLPVERAVAETAVWTTGRLVAVALAGVLGGVVVLLLERHTASLEYT